MFGLTMIKDYLDEILDGLKTCDVRSYPTNKRGTIALVDSKSMKVYGTIELVGVHKISPEEYANWHCTGRFEHLTFDVDPSKQYYAYDFINPRWLAQPIKLKVKKKTWVDIEDTVVKDFYFENKLF